LSHVLGQIPAQPWVGNSWAESKVFWFNVIGYQVYADEVRRYHESDAPIRITSAPARTSKSYSTAADKIPFLMPTRPLLSSLHWIVGPRYDQTKEFQYLYQWLVDERERFTLGGHELHVETAHNNAAHGDMLIVLDHGRLPRGGRARAVIKVLSGQRETDLQGEEVSTCVMSEAAEHPATIYQKYLASRVWKLDLPTTPKPYAEWIKELIEISEKDPACGVESFTFPPSANPTYNWDRYHREERKAAMRSPTGKAEDDPIFAEQFLGRWVYYTGAVFKAFHPSRNVLHEMPWDVAKTAKFVSIDYGYEDPACALLWSMAAPGIYTVIGEVYERHLEPGAFLERIHEMVGPYWKDVEYLCGDPARPEVARLFRDAGLPVWDRDKHAMRDRAAGFLRIIDLMSEGPIEGKPGLFVHSGCANLLREIRLLRYKEHFRNEYAPTSLEGDDHAIDAMRYGLMTRPTPRTEVDHHTWLQDHLDRVRRRTAFEHPMAARLGALGWAQSGRSPYAR
jgi:hypothetical protein